MIANNCFIIKLWYNSLPQYGQVIPFFFLFLDFFKGLKNSIPQLLHLYFSCFRIKFLLVILYFFLNISILQIVFSLMKVKKPNHPNLDSF